ncbi:MAG TPA: hypothetical protein VLG14_14640 [Sphingomonas sp.]|nr:hypothetical protein [Sphingomonas sp.]
MPLMDITTFIALLIAAALLIAGNRQRTVIAVAALALCGAIGCLWLLHWQAAGLAVIAVLTLGIAIALGRKRQTILGGALLVLTLAALLPYFFFPIFDLPVPDGRYRVGVRSFDLRDDARRGVAYTAPGSPRTLPVTIWYPAPADATGSARPYFTRAETWDEGRSGAKLWGFPVWRFLSLHATGTHGIEAAAIADGRFPVVVFNHGYWSFRAQNTALMERLASHGYIVVSVAHPRDSADVRLTDGTLIPNAPHFGPEGVGDPALDKQWEAATAAFMGGPDHARRIAAIPAYRAAVEPHRLGQSLRVWRDDALFVARTLRKAAPANAGDVFTRADFTRTVYAGMSFGGSTAVSACDTDPDCAAAVNLDGENFDGDQFDRAVRAPLLLMLTDQPFSQTQRAGYNPTDYAWERWHCIGDREDIVRLRARGLLHMGMSDLVLSARGPLKREHFTSLDGARAMAMVNDTVLAFLDAHVRGGYKARLRSVLARHPELERLDTRSLRIHAAGPGEREACRTGADDAAKR